MTVRKMMTTDMSSMRGDAAPLPRELWPAKRVAEYLGVPMGTLYQWRYLSLGPKAYRVGKWLRYDPEDVARWLAEECLGRVS